MRARQPARRHADWLHPENGDGGAPRRATLWIDGRSVNGSDWDSGIVVAPPIKRGEPPLPPKSSRLPRPLHGGDVAPAFPPLRASLRLRLLLLTNLVAAAVYVGWWLTPGHVGTPALFALLAVAETFSLLHIVGLWWTVWVTKIDPPPRRRTRFTIDVFVTTCGEPFEVLERTVAAAVAMDEPHRTFVLDDAGRVGVEFLAERLGAEYIARAERVGAKAGNLNHALAHTRGQLVAVFDADHVPQKGFLRRVLGYFEDPQLGFVQTPQFYGNGYASDIARGAYQQQAIFYGPICRGKSGVDAAFCCGTNVVFRRAALEAVGGFFEQSVVEDFVTSMHVHRRGWRSVYYPYVVSEGLGPTSLRAYFRQQFRWARGSIGALVSLEPFRHGFTLRQRLQYLLATTFYLTGVVTAAYVLLPILYLVGGWSAFSDSSGDFVFFYAPYMTLGLITIRWGLGGQLRLEHLRYTFGSFPVYAVAAVAAVLHLPARFRATGGARGRTRVPLLACLPVLASGATAAAIAVGLLVRPFDARTFTNVSWGVVNLLLLSGVVGALVRELVRGRRAAETGGPRVFAPTNGARPALELPEYALGPPRWSRIQELTERQRAALLVGVLTAVALVLRAALIEVQSLRLDESLSLMEAQVPLSTMLGNLLSWDVHPPLYYLLMHAWVPVAGTSEWALRLPSVLLGTATVPLLYLVGRRLAGTRAALFAAAFGAASPFWVWHSDEARMYPLFLCATLASTWLLLEALERDDVRRWGAYALVTALALYSHYFALLLPLVHLAYLLLHRVGRRRVLAWLGSIGVAGLLFLPWLLAFLIANGGPGGVGGVDTGIVVARQDHSVVGSAYALVLFLLVYVVGYGGSAGHGAGAVGLASRMLAGSWPLVAILGALSRRLGGWLRSRTALFLCAWLALTVGPVFALHFWKPGVWLHRYLIVSSPALFLLLGIALGQVVRRRVLGIALVLATLVPATVVSNLDRTNEVREDWRGAAALVERDRGPRDAVVIMPWFYATPFDYYDRGRTSPIGLLSAERTPRLTVEQDLPAVAKAHAGGALWVIVAYENVFDSERLIRDYLDRTFALTARFRLGGQMELRRYLIPAGWLPKGGKAES